MMMIFVLVLFAFPPLSRTFIPCYVYKESKYHMNSNYSNYGSIKIAVSVGHS